MYMMQVTDLNLMYVAVKKEDGKDLYCCIFAIACDEQKREERSEEQK